MWYKEWLGVRYKLILWLGGFGLITFFYMLLNVITPFQQFIFPNGDVQEHNTLFDEWLKSSQQYLPILAALGGLDLVSEETGKGTLSFLLAKPISRPRLYLVKLSVNFLTLASVILTGNLVILVCDQLPRTVEVRVWNEVKADDAFYAGFAGIGLGPSIPAEILPSLVSIAFVLLLCGTIIAITGLVSVFTANILQTLAFSVVPLWGLLMLVKSVGERFNTPMRFSRNGSLGFSPLGEFPLVSGTLEGRLAGVALMAVLFALTTGATVWLFQRKKF